MGRPSAPAAPIGDCCARNNPGMIGWRCADSRVVRVNATGATGFVCVWREEIVVRGPYPDDAKLGTGITTSPLEIIGERPEQQPVAAATTLGAAEVDVKGIDSETRALAFCGG